MDDMPWIYPKDKAFTILITRLLNYLSHSGKEFEITESIRVGTWDSHSRLNRQLLPFASSTEVAAFMNGEAVLTGTEAINGSVDDARIRSNLESKEENYGHRTWI